MSLLDTLKKNIANAFSRENPENKRPILKQLVDMSLPFEQFRTKPSLSKKVSDYFQPAPKVRTRDIFRELGLGTKKFIQETNIKPEELIAMIEKEPSLEAVKRVGFAGYIKGKHLSAEQKKLQESGAIKLLGMTEPIKKVGAKKAAELTRYWFNHTDKKFVEAVKPKPANVGKNIEAFVQKSPSGKNWQVIESKSGLKISDDLPTQKAAIEHATENITNRSEQELNDLIKKATDSYGFSPSYKTTLGKPIEDKIGFKLSPNFIEETRKLKAETMVAEPSVAPTKSPLLQEARKYKSAEEFVKSQGTLVFRGGHKISTESVTDLGISVSRNKRVADFFTKTKIGGETEELVISSNAKILSFDEIPINIKDKFTKLSKDISILEQLREAPKIMKNAERDLVNYAKKKGYDVVDISGFDDKAGKIITDIESEFRIVNPDILKTKSQLTDIWNKAQAKPKTTLGNKPPVLKPVEAIKPKVKPTPEIKPTPQLPLFVKGQKINLVGKTGDVRNVEFIEQRPEGILAKESTTGLPMLYKSDSFSVQKLSVVPTTNPLLQEARKYKSAEEFVKAQEKNNPLLETAKDFENADDFISFYGGSSTQYGKYKPEIRKFGTTEESIRVSELGVDPEKKITIYRGIDTVQGGKMQGTINDGDFVTTDFDSANSYTGGKVVSKEVKAKDLILDYPEKSDYQNPFYKGAEFIYSDSKNQIIKRSEADLRKIFDEAKSYQIKIPLTEWEKQSAYIQKNGKIPPNADLKGYSKSPEYNKYGTTERQRASSYYEYVSNKIDEAIKTKSQLTDIWNKAQEGKGVPPSVQAPARIKPEIPAPQKPPLPERLPEPPKKSDRVPYQGTIPQEQEKLQTAVSKIIEALKGAKSVRKIQETLYTKERGIRLGKALGVRKQIGGEKGFYAELAQMKGKLPKAEFESIRKNVTQDDIDTLFNAVKDTNVISEWEKFSARDGLVKLFGESGGRVPTEGELKLLNRVFGDEFVKAMLAKRGLWEKIKEAGFQLLNVPRSLMASVDLSAPLRQGVFFVGRPKQFVPAFLKMFKMFGSEKAFKTAMQDISARPTFELMRDTKLALTDMDAMLTSREEQFMSNWAEKIPVLGRLVRASGRAYTGFLNKLRADVFDDLVRKAENSGLKPQINRDLTKEISHFINAATGRGSLGGLERSAKVLNSLFFSPRLMASRLTLLNPVYYMRATPFVRKEALKSLFTFASTGLTILGLAKLGGADVVTDARSADFSKIKIGNTRLDIWGGFQQYIKTAAQLISGQIVSSTTGKTFTLGEGYKPITRLDILGRALEYKEAPVVSFITNLLRGQTALGEDINLRTEVQQRFTPMVMQDIYEIAQDNPDILPLSILGIFGVGVQTYQDKTKAETKTPLKNKPSLRLKPKPTGGRPTDKNELRRSLGL